MKSDIYAYITTVILVMACGFSLFLIYSDNDLPFTTQATVKTNSVDVIPQVTGYIDQIYVHEGEYIKVGMPLFKINAQTYQITEKKAWAIFLQAQSRWMQAKHDLARMILLKKRNSVSKETVEEAQTREAIAQSVFLSAKTEVDRAKLNVERTLIKAQQEGFVTNLTFTQGMLATTSTPVIHLVKNTGKWIEADFTEKGLGTLKKQPIVDIVYDALPNQVFSGQVISVDHAISSGLSEKNQLGIIASESRWIRPQQKVRVRIISSSLPQALIAGSRASVMVKGDGFLAGAWMHLLSWLRYIY